MVLEVADLLGHQLQLLVDVLVLLGGGVAEIEREVEFPRSPQHQA